VSAEVGPAQHPAADATMDVVTVIRHEVAMRELGASLLEDVRARHADRIKGKSDYPLFPVSIGRDA
jgi:hypothetical protein